MNETIYEVSLLDAVALFFLLSTATATVALTIAKSSMFGWLRKLLPNLKLIHCPWCLGFWISAALILITGIYDGLLWPVIFWLAMSGVAGLISGVVDKIYFWTERERDMWYDKYMELANEIGDDESV